MKVLGTQDGESLQIGKKVTAIQIQQKNCEAETLKVFRLLTSQVCMMKNHVFNLIFIKFYFINIFITNGHLCNNLIIVINK